jgi:cellulose synthase/poly-beta-1,6-N-acetylglucosamine synthase-like glycosyltransferase
MCISDAGTILRWFSGPYLMRSSSHILLSLLPISGWLNRSLIIWLLFCAVQFLWFFAYVLKTSLTYGMRKSLCKVTFDMYQGALASFLNVLDWDIWIIFVLGTGVWKRFLDISVLYILLCYIVLSSYLRKLQCLKVRRLSKMKEVQIGVLPENPTLIYQLNCRVHLKLLLRVFKFVRIYQCEFISDDQYFHRNPC